MKAGTSHASVV